MSAAPRVILRYPERVAWTAVTIGIPAWMAHLVFEASMVHYTTVHPGSRWTLHLATVLTAAVTIAGMVICYNLRRAAIQASRAGDGDERSPAALSHFLGNLGLMIGAANLALILLEGSYVIFVSRNG